MDEVETKIDNAEAMGVFLEKIGFKAFRQQEKRRHSFILNKVLVEIDEWPSIPVYVETEGQHEDELKNTAEVLGLDWKNAYYGSAKNAIENIYNVPVSGYRYFTFNRVGN